VKDLHERTHEIARGCGSPEADPLHWLIAATRIKCLAQELLAKVGLDLTTLRNSALSFYLSGRMPRKLPPAGQAGGRPTPRAAEAVRARTPSALARPSVRDLVEAPAVEPSGPAAEPEPQSLPEPADVPAASPGGHELDPRKFPFLSELTRNLTAQA